MNDEKLERAVVKLYDLVLELGAAMNAFGHGLVELMESMKVKLSEIKKEIEK